MADEEKPEVQAQSSQPAETQSSQPAGAIAPADTGAAEDIEPRLDRIKRVGKKILLHAIFLFCLITLVRFITETFAEEIKSFFNWADTNQPLSFFVFIGVQSLAVTVTIPYTLFAMAGGFIFGFPLGYMCNVLGWSMSMVNAMILVRNPIANKRRDKWREWLFEKFDKIRVFNDLIAERPYFAVTMIRLTLLPTFAKNYGLAIIGAPLLPGRGHI
jgi:uncharacterized membrane protein YdjX (TVP38/TMEM64 family)